MEKAGGGHSDFAGKGIVTPERLGDAVESTIGSKAYGYEGTPLAAYAKAGQRATIPAKESPSETIMKLATVLAGGAGLGSLAGHEGLHQAGGNDSYGLGYLGGGLLGGASGLTTGKILRSPVMQRYLRNQAIPRSVSGRFLDKELSQPAILAETLARTKREKQPTK
jgi:hypothetical protein